MATTKTKSKTVTFMEVTIRGYELRVIGANRAECIAAIARDIDGGGFGECLTAWAEDNPEDVEGHASPLEAWIEYAGAFCAEMTPGTVTWP
ncbi:MAG TPA: hypothetical protein VMW08_00795 [Acidimicrobiales bacterium]|nr:hypothetical protein [Acidimicrobiales bacterium]